MLMYLIAAFTTSSPKPENAWNQVGFRRYDSHKLGRWAPKLCVKTAL